MLIGAPPQTHMHTGTHARMDVNMYLRIYAHTYTYPSTRILIQQCLKQGKSKGILNVSN